MKHKKKVIIVLIVEFLVLSLLLVMIFFAGKKTYTVTFDLNGGTLLSGETTQKVTQGQNANPPQVTKNGCYFLNWSTSYRQVTKDLVIRAIWEYETTPGIEYETKEDSNYCEIVGAYKGIAGDVFIGAYHNEKKVLGIREGAFEGCENIVSIYLLDGIINIEDRAFAGCTSLEKIEMPSTLLMLGDEVFKDCASLETITLPNSLKTIGEYAFAGCTALKEILIPESVKTIGKNAFDNLELVISTPLKATEQPTGWAQDWYVNASVVWEYVDNSGNEEEETE